MDRDEALALVERMLSTMEDSGGFWADDLDGPRTYPSEVLAALRSPQEEAGGERWTCYHCRETFDDAGAEEHFGPRKAWQRPLCVQVAKTIAGLLRGPFQDRKGMWDAINAVRGVLASDTDLPLAALARSPGGTEGDEESARCSCEWMSPEDGAVGHEWPAVLDVECTVHGAPNGIPWPWWVRDEDEARPPAEPVGEAESWIVEWKRDGESWGGNDVYKAKQTAELVARHLVTCGMHARVVSLHRGTATVSSPASQQEAPDA